MSDASSPPAASPFGQYQRITPDTVELATEGPPVAGQPRSQRLRCAGVERRIVLYVPAGHDGHTPLPLVLNLHGSTSYPEEQLMLSGFLGAADRHRVAVLAPEGLERLWNVPHDPGRADDTEFIADAIELAANRVPLDLERCHATGFSGGARMLAELATGLPRPLRAIAPVSGVRFASGCASDRRPAVFAFHGGLDKVNPYDGGGFAYWQTGVEDEVEAWARHNGVADRRRAVRSDGVTRTVFGVGSHRVELYRVDALGHIWAGFPGALGELFDPPSTAVDATLVMLAGFASLG